MKYYKLHLIRHGLTQGNLDGRYIGSGTDLPLCAEGRAQLEELKAKFQYPDVPLVFCSPMLRAQQTAEVLFPNAKLTILQDLREMNFGKFENRPITELVKDPEFAQWMDPTSRTNPDGAEDRKAFYDRTNVMLMKLFEYQLRTHTEEAACITHGGVIMNMMANHVLPQHKPEEWMTTLPKPLTLCPTATWTVQKSNPVNTANINQMPPLFWQGRHFIFRFSVVGQPAFSPLAESGSLWGSSALSAAGSVFPSGSSAGCKAASSAAAAS